MTEDIYRALCHGQAWELQLSGLPLLIVEVGRHGHTAGIEAQRDRRGILAFQAGGQDRPFQVHVASKMWQLRGASGSEKLLWQQKGKHAQTATVMEYEQDTEMELAPFRLMQWAQCC